MIESVDMPLGLALGVLVWLAVIAGMAVYMVREPGKQAVTYFAGMFTGAMAFYLLACEVPAFTGPNGMQFAAKGKAPAIGDWIMTLFSLVGNLPIDPNAVNPALVGTIFWAVVIAAGYLAVAKLLHLKPFEKRGGGVFAGGAAGRRGV